MRSSGRPLCGEGSVAVTVEVGRATGEQGRVLTVYSGSTVCIAAQLYV